MDASKCPICGNPGIPNYLEQEVRCPHCGSDLSVYKTIHEVTYDENAFADGTQKYKIMAIVLPIVMALIVGGGFYLFGSKTRNELRSEIALKDTSIIQLEDSIKDLNTQLKSQESIVPGDIESHYFEYTILYKDSPWAIVNKFYGKRSDWAEISKRIALDNGIWDEQRQEWKAIRPGQVIKIYSK